MAPELVGSELKRALAFGKVLPEGQFDERFPFGAPPSGILCPWNRNTNGPAKQRIWCYVWANEADFNDWGAEGNFWFCRSACHYGHMEAAQRSRAWNSHKAFLVRKRWHQRFARKIAGFRLRDRFGRPI